jgi:hypothetical protein
MARYIQRIALLGKERWIGWEVDGVGTEIPGLILADDIPEEEIRKRGIKEFRPMPFESFLGLGAHVAEALMVGMERFRSRGQTDVPRTILIGIFGDDRHLEHPSVQQRFQEWERNGRVKVMRGEDCYLKITGRLA